MAYLDRDGPVFQVGQNAVESLHGGPSEMERLRELQQQGAESARVQQRFQPGQRLCHRLLRARLRLVGHRAVGLGRESKRRQIGCAAEPGLRDPWRDRTVEAGVDLDRVDEARHEGQSIEAPSDRRGIHDALPVRIVPPRHAAADHSALAAGAGS